MPVIQSHEGERPTDNEITSSRYEIQTAATSKDINMRLFFMQTNNRR